MRARAVRHIRGNLWYWTIGVGAAGAAAALMGFGTPAAFLFMITGILGVMADAHVDPLAVITEDALHPEDAEVDQPTVKDSTLV